MLDHEDKKDAYF